MYFFFCLKKSEQNSKPSVPCMTEAGCDRLQQSPSGGRLSDIVNNNAQKIQQI